jgi:hypothetical protein
MMMMVVEELLFVRLAVCFKVKALLDKSRKMT